MKRSSGPRKTASNLSESFHQHLNIYAIEAGAALVGMLGLAQPVEAKIVYTPTNVHIALGQHYDFDFDHDGFTDFEILDTTEFGHYILWLSPTQGGGNGAVKNGRGDPAALNRGAQIGAAETFFDPSIDYGCHHRRA